MRAVLIPFVLVLLTGCSIFQATTTTTTTTLPPPPPLGAESPEEAVETWLAELADRDYQSTMRLVPDSQLALLVGTEGLSAAQVLLMLEEGVPSVVRRNFWLGFSEAFPSFSGEGLEGLVVGEAEPFEVGERSFAAVQVVFRERLGSGEVVAHRDEEGRWWVDLFATFGPAFARPLRVWMETLPVRGDGARVRTALGEQQVSLLAALERRPMGEVPEATVAELRYLLAEISG